MDTFSLLKHWEDNGIICTKNLEQIKLEADIYCKLKEEQMNKRADVVIVKQQKQILKKITQYKNLINRITNYISLIKEHGLNRTMYQAMNYDGLIEQLKSSNNETIVYENLTIFLKQNNESELCIKLLENVLEELQKNMPI